MRTSWQPWSVAPLLLLAGCTVPWMQPDSSSELERRGEAVQEVMESEDRPQVVGDAASILWADRRQYEGYGLVNGLMDTGGDVRPSNQRDYILKEMRAEGIDKPNTILAHKATALVSVTVDVGPEHSKGDQLDARVQLSDQCDASSLRNGWLMPTHIREMLLLGGSVRQSELKARATGDLLILPESITKKKPDPLQAVILGGAQLVETRHLGLAIRGPLRHVTTTANISRAINDRYSFYDGSERRGVATAKNDQLIQIDMPPRFRWDVQHYADVIRSVGFGETTEQTQARMEKCGRGIHEPTTARRSCLQLEAIGKEGISLLVEGMSNSDPEIRFHAAYSLAYLDYPGAAPVLAALARDQSDLRHHALIGLQVLNHYSAKEALEELLHDPQADLRYGALLALRRRESHDAWLDGFHLSGLTHVVSIPTATPLVAVSLQQRPEIAIFGGNCEVKMNEFFEVNPRMTMRPDTDGQLRIVRFQPNDEDLTAIVAPDLLSVLEGFRKVGAKYNDLVGWLEAASHHQWLSAPLAMNPRPDSVYLGLSAAAESVKEPKIEETTVEPDTTVATKKSWWPWK